MDLGVLRQKEDRETEEGASLALERERVLGIRERKWREEVEEAIAV